MSRSHNFKPEFKKPSSKTRSTRRVVLSDFDIEFIEMSLGPTIRLRI